MNSWTISPRAEFSGSLLLDIAKSITSKEYQERQGYLLCEAIVSNAHRFRMPAEGTNFLMVKAVLEGVTGGSVAEMVCDADYTFTAILRCGEEFLRGFRIWLRKQ